jgi:hypothetical protein
MARLATTLSLALGAEALLVGTPAARPSLKVAMADTNFYAVSHTFAKNANVEEWWGQVAEADFAAMAKEQHAGGIFNHYFLPSAVEGPILCVWECKDTEMGSKDFADFIDGPTSPAGEALVNKVYPINPAASGLASAWPTMPKEAVASTGSFFYVQHAFNKGKASEFWDGMAEVDLDAFAAANKAKGFSNHLFMPTTDPSTVFCVWESKEPMAAADFQTFIDAEVFPGVFKNTVYEVMPGAQTPSAAFPVSWFDSTYAKIEELLPLKLDEIVAKIKEATKMA